MREFKRNRQALNPLATSVSFMAIMVVISVLINLLAGTSAASIGKEEIRISKVNFSFGDSITVLAENSGTTSVTIKEVWINDTLAIFTAEPSGNIAPGEYVNILIKYVYANSTNYRVRITSGTDEIQTITAKAP